jgi:hypothetical protein
MNLVLSAAEDVGENAQWELAARKPNDAERSQRLAAHGIDVRQCVGGSDLSELIGIIDDRREEVDGLHKREIGGQPKNPRVIEGLATDKNSGIRFRAQRREGAGQVTRTQLGGSTSAARELGKAERLLSEVGHESVGR